ncbi:MAG: cytochrome c biogenesis protein, partial [Gemmataceae bacterium]
RMAPAEVLQRLNLKPGDVNNLPPERIAELDNELEKVRVELFAGMVAADPAAMKLVSVFMAYRSGDPQRLAEAVENYKALIAEKVPESDLARVRFEVGYNNFAPYYWCIVLYAAVTVLALTSFLMLFISQNTWIGFRRAAFWVLLLTFALHMFALFARMYLMERPFVFVTNLFSSAVFIGAGAVAFCMVIERIFPLGLGTLVAGLLGFLTTAIGHNIGAGSDTLEMMQAVLDTNIWLATHVTTVTLGYSATYISGLIGMIYIFSGIFTPLLNQPTNLRMGPNAPPLSVGRAMGMMMYGIICVAMLFSFVGTVLGGIWADQSWGRFWGWDPKENGAVLIVIMNALILHARWAGLVKDRGIALLSIFGMMVTTWSWFGTNQLGVGLHAYGFSKDLADFCKWTWLLLGGFITGALLLPRQLWASFADAPAIAQKP